MTIHCKWDDMLILEAEERKEETVRKPLYERDFKDPSALRAQLCLKKNKNIEKTSKQIFISSLFFFTRYIYNKVLIYCNQNLRFNLLHYFTALTSPAEKTNTNVPNYNRRHSCAPYVYRKKILIVSSFLYRIRGDRILGLAGR